MAIQKKEFGVMPSGEKVYEYTLTNKSGVSASFIVSATCFQCRFS